MSGPVRVLTIIDSLLIGGAERIAVEIACAVDRRRFEPHVLVTRCTGPLAARLVEAEIPYTVLDRRHRFAHGAYRAARALSGGCDLVHAHKIGGSLWGVALTRSRELPLIVHEHNSTGNPSPADRLAMRLLIVPAAEAVLCVTSTVASALPGRSQKLRIVPNAVGSVPLAREVARARLGLAPDERCIGITARLRPEKAHHVLLRAFRLLNGGLAGAPPRLCVVGDGPERARLERLASDLGVEDRIVWAGEVVDGERLVKAFDVAVLCSDWEGLPLAALEAAAAGVPLVATAVGGLIELLDGIPGSLVPAGDVDALAAALARVLDDPLGAAADAERLRMRVQSELRHDAMIDAVEATYEEALARRPHRASVALA